MGSPPAQTTTSSPTMDPALKAALMGNVGTANQITSGVLPNADGTMADGSTFAAPKSLVADFTPDQLASFQKIQGIANNPLTPSQLGGDTYSKLAGFSAPSVASSNIDPAYMHDIAPVTAGSMQAGQVGAAQTVTPKNFTDYNIGAYSSPYMSQVVDPVQSYYNTMGDRAASSAAMQSRAAGAARGSDPAIAQALAREGVAQQAGLALSPLYQNAFQTAAGLVQGDQGRDLSAQQSNQGAALQAATTQAGLNTTAASNNLTAEQQAALANQETSARYGLANQATNLAAQSTNADNALRAGLANQGAAINSAGIQSGAAAGIAGANQGAQNSAITGAGLLNQSGNQQQSQQQALINQILQALGIRQSAVTSGLAPTTGQTSTTTGGGSGVAGLLGGLGSLASGAGALGLTI